METNNITVSGFGKNNPANNFFWLIYLILAVGCGIIIFMMIAGAEQIFGIDIPRYSRSMIFYYPDTVSPWFPQFVNANFWIVFSFIALILGFVETVIKTSAVEKTYINVTSDGVEGKYVSGKFNFGAYRVRDFKLANTDIESVKTSKNFIELSSLGKTYRIYVKNVEEIKSGVS